MTPEQLKKILPTCKDTAGWAAALTANLPLHGIVTPQQQAAFLAQVGHESADLNVLSENLNYSQQGLRKTFSKYFTDDVIAARYARQPQWIASRVYAGRMGNGSEQSKDGWTYRGRGVLQVTGKSNYARCSTALFGDDRLLQNPDLLLEQGNAVLSACWFWTENKLLQHANDVIKTTKIVNGGKNGLDHRQEIFVRALAILA